MRVFVSWSGESSGAFARAFSDWLGAVLQSCRPWISEQIEKGKRWTPAIEQVSRPGLVGGS